MDYLKLIIGSIFENNNLKIITNYYFFSNNYFNHIL